MITTVNLIDELNPVLERFKRESKGTLCRSKIVELCILNVSNHHLYFDRNHGWRFTKIPLGKLEGGIDERH